MELKDLIREGEILDEELRLSVKVDKFVDMFGDVWRYDVLIEKEQAGWDDVFENWHERGLI